MVLYTVLTYTIHSTNLYYVCTTTVKNDIMAIKAWGSLQYGYNILVVTSRQFWKDRQMKYEQYMVYVSFLYVNNILLVSTRTQISLITHIFR